MRLLCSLPLLLVAAACSREHGLLGRSASFVGDTRYIPAPTAPDGTGVSRRYGGGGGGGVVVYMNFDGGDISCAGYDDSSDNESLIACEWCSGTCGYPAFDQSGFGCSGSKDECIGLIMDQMLELWEEYNISFTASRPSSGDYEMVMIGGSAGGAAGVALLDCTNSFPSNVSFVFSDVLAGAGSCSRGLLVTAASQELAHALGLCHNDDCDSSPSVMCPYTADCDSEWSCGSQVDSCYCEGYGYDPYCPSDYLLDLLGPATPDTTAPTVSITDPLEGQTIPDLFTITAEFADDRGVARLELYEDGAVDPSVAHEWPTSPDSFTSNPNYAPGVHSFSVVAWDEAGNSGMDTVTVTVSGDIECIAGSCCCQPACCERLDDCSDCVNLTPTGGRCGGDGECQGGMCLGNRSQPDLGDICTQGCDGEGDCPTGFDCMTASGMSFCWPSVGKECGSDADCPAGACVRDGEGDGFCTVPCSGDGSCPGDYRCGSVGDVNVCLPGGNAGAGRGCGCAVGARRSSEGGAALALLALALALAAAAPRRRAR